MNIHRKDPVFGREEAMARRAGLFLLVVAFLLVSSPALCGEDGFGGLDAAGDEMALFEEIPSVFGASKYEQKVTEAPSSVSIVTAAEIEKYGYRTLGDILQSLRSFHITNDRNYSYGGVRGFGRPGDYNSRMLLLVDGHRINDNIYQSAIVGHDFVVDVDLIDRLEVIRGPSSSIYGTSAFFSVINVITKRGRDYQGVEVSGEAASHDTYDGRLSYGDRYAGGFELLLSGSGSDSEGDDHYYPEFDDPATNNGIAEGLDGEGYHNLYLKASLADLILTGAYVSREKDYPTAPWWAVFNHPDSFTLDERSYLALKYDHLFDNDWNVVGRLFYDNYYYEGEYPFDWNEDPADPDIFIGRDEAEGEWWGTELQFSKRLWDRHQVVLGGEYRDNLKQDQYYWDDKTDPSSLLLDSTEQSDSWALFIQDEFKLLDSLVLNVGLRHDDYSTFGGTTNPRAALIYNPLEKTTMKLLYGEAFRTPNVYESFYHDGGFSSKANPDLDPETIETYEVVMEQYLGDHLRSVVSGFYYEIEDLIDLSSDPADGLLFFANLDEVEAWGLEMELEGKWDNGLAGRVSYSFQETEDKKTGKVLTNSPKHLAKVNLTVPVWRDKVFLGIEEQYTSGRGTVETEDKTARDLGGYAVTNLTLFSQSLLEGLEVSASIYNLFDKRFSVVGSGEHLQSAIEQDDRTFRVKVTYAF